MQALKNIVINGAMILALLFGLMISATAEEPLKALEDLAEKGNVNMQALVAYSYEFGAGVRQDYNKAFYWHQKAANQGDKYSQYSIGSAYADGKGVRQDYSKALEWFKKAANQNSEFAQHTIGSMYEYGKGVRQNKSIAKEWYGKSCDNGFQDGCDSYKQLNEQGY